jgi:hypothetical protein
MALPRQTVFHRAYTGAVIDTDEEIWRTTSGLSILPRDEGWGSYFALKKSAKGKLDLRCDIRSRSEMRRVSVEIEPRGSSVLP